MTPTSTQDLDACQYLYLAEISEPASNNLRLLLEEGITSNQTETLEINGVVIEGVRPIEVTAASRTFEVIWPSYIGYAVRNESYTGWDKEEEWTGTSFRVYSKSKFLDFIANGTIATAEYPGPFQHYEIICCDQIIDIASEDQPIIRLIRV